MQHIHAEPDSEACEGDCGGNIEEYGDVQGPVEPLHARVGDQAVVEA